MITLQKHFWLHLLIICAFMNKLGSSEETQKTEETKHYDKDGSHNLEYDHEAFLGEDAKSFNSLTPEESKERLGIIVDKIDNNKDGKVTHVELKDWIKYTQDKYVRDNVDRAWKQYNPENKDSITWDDYSNTVYSFMNDLSPEELNKQEGGVSYKSLYERDRRRWVSSDLDANNGLTKTEFMSFLHPEEVPHMRDLVVQEAIEEMDKDKDGKISLNEYIDVYEGDLHGTELPEWVEKEIETFHKYRDFDKDGFLTGNEIKSIVVPDGFDHSDAEARHLISEADTNDDGTLTKDEIIAKYDVFVGSQATDFGEALMRHDEF